MKYLTSTYLKDIEEYKISIFMEEKCCITVKKILKIKEPFVLKEENNNITIIDNGYYILEYMPFNENYICRVHIDKEENVIERFYTATKNNSIINGIPAFEDLKLSYVSVVNKNINKFYNMELAKEILNIQNYSSALSQMIKIQNEIKNKENYIYNLDYEKYLI